MIKFLTMVRLAQVVFRMAPLLLTFGLCQEVRVVVGDESICRFFDDPSGLKRHFIHTLDGFTCDVIGTDNDCVEELRRRGVVTGDCGLLTSTYSKCLVNRTLIANECCHQGQQQNCSNATSTQGTTGLTDISTAATSTVPNLNSTADIPDPPMKDDNDPYIPVYYVFGIIIALIIVVVAVVFSVWCYHKYKLKCVSPSVRDDPGGDNPPNQVGNPIVAIPMENRGAAGARGIDTDGRRQSSPSQEKSQDASQDGSQVPSTTDTKLSAKENELRRRKLPTEETRQEITKEDSDWLPTRTAAPFSEDSGKGCTSKSVMQPFPNTYKPPTVDSIVLDMSSPNVPTASQASDDGNSSYVPTPPKSSSLVRKQDLVTAHMSHLECKDGTQEKPSMSSVVQGYMQSLDQDDQEADAFVVQQKVKVGGDISSAVAHKQRSCFKSGGTDDETHGSVSGKGPLKKHKFPPAHFGNVGVAIICALTLATFVCHGRGYTSTTLHPSLAYKYRWFDRGTPWIRALADRLAYPQMFDLHNLGLAAYCGIFPMTLTTLSTLYNQCQRKTADPTVNDQTSSLAYNYQWLDRGTWIGAIAYPFIFGSPNLRLAVYCGIVLTTLALVIMATTLISLFDQYQPGPIRAPLAVKYCVSLAAIKSCRWTGIAPHVNIPPHLSLQIGAASAF
ncbi:uncharacterized protein LOC135345713 isoform X6 [Halichondria panicea]|uniref:uncharacterized protein LOC135345713 isoform X6 n=1 Tax=Halichondria panicea TaxID=6063 RepID=UPI00312B9775